MALIKATPSWLVPKTDLTLISQKKKSSFQSSHHCVWCYSGCFHDGLFTTSSQPASRDDTTPDSGSANSSGNVAAARFPDEVSREKDACVLEIISGLEGNGDQKSLSVCFFFKSFHSTNNRLCVSNTLSAFCLSWVTQTVDLINTKTVIHQNS